MQLPAMTSQPTTTAATEEIDGVAAAVAGTAAAAAAAVQTAPRCRLALPACAGAKMRAGRPWACMHNAGLLRVNAAQAKAGLVAGLVH